MPPLKEKTVIALLLGMVAACAHQTPSASDDKFERLVQRLDELTEQVGRQHDEMERLSARFEIASAKESPSREVAMKIPQVPVTRIVPLMPEPEESEGHTVVDSSHEEMHIYYKGLQAMKANRFEEALRDFRNFLSEDPDHVYADRAQYNTAQTHYLNKEFSLVIVATNLIETRYPRSLILPEALVKKGLSYLALGQAEPGKATLQNILRRYPDTAAAKVAALKLSEISRN